MVGVAVSQRHHREIWGELLPSPWRDHSLCRYDDTVKPRQDNHCIVHSTGADPRRPRWTKRQCWCFVILTMPTSRGQRRCMVTGQDAALCLQGQRLARDRERERLVVVVSGCTRPCGSIQAARHRVVTQQEQQRCMWRGVPPRQPTVPVHVGGVLQGKVGQCGRWYDAASLALVSNDHGLVSNRAGTEKDVLKKLIREEVCLSLHRTPAWRGGDSVKVSVCKLPRAAGCPCIAISGAFEYGVCIFVCACVRVCEYACGTGEQRGESECVTDAAAVVRHVVHCCRSVSLAAAVCLCSAQEGMYGVCRQRIPRR
ncbi:hypothetical protein LY76DRAFT_326243 [Colletotrichum caudatum]|nr:hypothetical protein LY76DRAFT_326243 [Colletotrichum caudatum]